MSELPAGWRLEPLSALGAWVGGATPSKSVGAYWSGGDVPWVSPKDMKSVDITDTEDHVTTQAIQESALKRIDTGSVLVVTRSGILKRNLPVAVTKVPVVVNQDLKALTPRTDLSPRWVYWALRRDEKEILRRCTKSGTTVQSVEFPQFLQWNIPVPPRAEQDRIVAAIEEQLSRIEAGVSAIGRSDARLGTLRRATVSSIVSGDLLQASHSEWQSCMLGTLGTLDRGKSRHRPRNDPSLYGGRYPFVQTGDVSHADPWIDSFSQTYNDQGLAQSRLWPSGTLCITIAANIGKTGLLTFDACFPDSVVGFVALDGHLMTRWVDLVLRSLQHQLEAMAPATAQKNINLAVLRRLPIPVPPATYIERSIEEFDRMHSSVGSLQKTIAAGSTKARRLRDAVLAAAFHGTLTAPLG